MAKYQWTGAGETVGQAPALFANVWGGTIGEWEVQEDLTADIDGKVLAFINTTGGNARRTLQLTAAGSSISGRVDIRGRFWKAGNDGSMHFSRAYIAGGSGTETAVYTDYVASTGDGWRFASYNAGSFSSNEKSQVLAGEGWYRFRVLHDPNASTDRHKLWVWADADPEPSTPLAINQLSILSASAAGGLGVGLFSAQEAYLDWISFGTGTDDADDLSAPQATTPTLSSPSATGTGSGGFSASVSTNVGSGTLYYVVTESATAPSATQVKAGQDNAGSPATVSGSQAVSASGAQQVTGTGITDDVTYYVHFVHTANTNDSGVATSAGFLNEAPLLAPTNLSATSITETTARLSWTRGA